MKHNTAKLEHRMNCRKTKKLISSYLAPNEPWLKPRDRMALEAHFAVCDACREACEETRTVVELIQKHCQISADTQVLLDSFERREELLNSPNLPGIGPAWRKMAAVAAAIVICLGIGHTYLSTQDLQKPQLLVQVDGQDQPAAPEIKVTENGLAVSSGAFLTTGGTQIREFTINGRHRLVMNRDTTLSIDRLIEDGKLGCLVSLRSGEILVHVAYDGNPFEVRSPHGRAVITGTTFDVNVTGQEMHLVVSEGSVRFGSGLGSVQVTAGTRSVLADQDMPSSPVLCQADQLMAWALAPTTPSGESDLSPELGAFVDELSASMPSLGPHIDLASLDYEQWIEAERDWFKAQFPWIFELQDAIRANGEIPRNDGSVPSYPELLLQTGDIWQIVYPERIYRIIPVLDSEVFSNIVSNYGLDEAGLTQGILSLNGRHIRQQGMVFGLASLETWLSECRKIQKLCDGGGETGDLFEYSQAMAEYLEHTRALAWLCVRNGRLQVAAEHREKMLDLLGTQVVRAHVIRTAWREFHILGGGDPMLATYRSDIAKAIGAIRECDRGIAGMLGASITEN